MKLYNCKLYIPFIIMYTAKCYICHVERVPSTQDLESACSVYKDTTCMIVIQIKSNDNVGFISYVGGRPG